MVGDLRLARGYYHCRHCHRGHAPWDETLRLTAQRLTPAAREVTALAGIQESFGKAAGRTLRKLAGLRVSESTAQRTTEAVGRHLAEQRAAGKTFGGPCPYAWHRDRTGKTCA